MSATQEDFLKLFYRPEEYGCFGMNVRECHYINLWEDEVNSEHIKACERFSLNPLVMYREDKNVTSFRNFMIESDTLSMEEICEHIKKSGIPVSVCVFSGNKSLHFYICLEDSLGDVDMYKFVGRWILSALGAKNDMVDGHTFIPSTLARLGGAHNCKTGKKQTFKILKGIVKNADLEKWLLDNIEHKPEIEKTEIVKRSTIPNRHLLSDWTKYILEEGIYSKKKNCSYYQMAHDFYQAGFDEEECFDFICQNSLNIQQNNFNTGELRGIIRSAYKKLVK